MSESASLLTARELQVAELTAQELSRFSIAQILGISERTVRNYRRAIFKHYGITGKHKSKQLASLPKPAPGPEPAFAVELDR